MCRPCMSSGQLINAHRTNLRDTILNMLNISVSGFPKMTFSEGRGRVKNLETALTASRWVVNRLQDMNFACKTNAIKNLKKKVANRNKGAKRKDTEDKDNKDKGPHKRTKKTQKR